MKLGGVEEAETVARTRLRPNEAETMAMVVAVANVRLKHGDGWRLSPKVDETIFDAATLD